MPHLFAGTSGFAYPSWKPTFYPAKLPSTKFLEHYAKRLNSVEINYTFRRMPAASTLENWVWATQPGFTFCVKAHMRITHILQLQDASDFTDLFLQSLEPLHGAQRLGPVLFQLPPQFPCDAVVLDAFLKGLRKDLRYAFEFRHVSWLVPPIYQLLEKHRAALCLAESEKLKVPEVATAEFVYYRFRKEEYSPEDRKRMAARVDDLLSQGKDVFVFFKHEETPAGAFYAEELLKKS